MGGSYNLNHELRASGAALECPLHMHIRLPHNIFNILIIAVFLLLPDMAAAEIVDIETRGKEETLTLNVPGAQKGGVFTLAGPYRLVVDVPTLPKNIRPTLPRSYKGTLINSVRTGQFDKDTTRIVFELSGSPGAVDSKPDGESLVITLEPGSAPKPKQKAEKKPEGKPVIVIDAGHGGQDPGTIGPRGTKEKNLVLDYARALKRQLAGRYRVYLTRNDDTFILLRGRNAVARKVKADMFISIHADSDPGNSARGLSVYTLSEKASDAEAEALAARENRVDVVYGLDLSDQSEDVADILISLAQRDTNNRSATLAGLLTDASTLGQVKLLENAHRFAGFAVLKSPDITSVLVEVGFLSNSQEEKLLQSKAHRERVVKALSRGIDAYFAARRDSAP